MNEIEQYYNKNTAICNIFIFISILVISMKNIYDLTYYTS
jgi:hypothetical protein